MDPVYDEARTTYNFWAYGDFVNVPDPMWFRVTLRETPLERKGSLSFVGPLVTEKNPPPPGQHIGIMREPAQPKNGGFLGMASCPRYDTTTYKYEMKIVFESAKGGATVTPLVAAVSSIPGFVFEATPSKVIATYKQNNSEWLPFPKP